MMIFVFIILIFTFYLITSKWSSGLLEDGGVTTNKTGKINYSRLH